MNLHSQINTPEKTKTNITDFKDRHQTDFFGIAKSWENNRDELFVYFRYFKKIGRLIYSTDATLSSSVKHS